MHTGDFTELHDHATRVARSTVGHRRGQRTAAVGGKQKRIDRREREQQKTAQRNRGQNIARPFVVAREHIGGRVGDTNSVLVKSISNRFLFFFFFGFRTIFQSFEIEKSKK